VTKSDKHTLIFFLIAGPIIFFTAISINLKSEAEIDLYMKNLDLKLIGRVTDIKITRQHDFGLVSIDVIETNKQYYDTRGNTSPGYYFCVIKNGKAEIETSIGSIKIGDSLIIDTEVRKITDFRNNKLLFTDFLSFSDAKSVLDEIKNYHKIK
jgi:hypothetical protein